MRTIANLFCLGALLLAAGCSRSSGPADFSAASCFEVAVTDSAVHVLFGLPGENNGGAIALYHSRSADGDVWPRPVPVDTGHAVPGNHKRGNDPQLAAWGDRLLALWTAEGGGPWGSGPLGASVSLDGGQSWQPAPVPAVPGVPADAGYRFPAVAADNEAFHVIWIHAQGEERSLRYAQMRHSTGSWTEPVTIDPHICACCWLRLESVDGNLVALYRDYEPSDMRMAVSNDRGQTWEKRRRAGAFDWQFKGCPHVGGGLALGESVQGAPLAMTSVWTGEPGAAGSYLFRSGDLGETWEAVSGPWNGAGPGRNTDLVLAPGGISVLAWDVLADSGFQEVHLAVTRDAGASWEEVRRLSTPGRNASHPRIVALNGRALIFWSEIGPDGVMHLLTEAVALPVN